jgi:hypothetical protein
MNRCFFTVIFLIGSIATAASTSPAIPAWYNTSPQGWSTVQCKTWLADSNNIPAKAHYTRISVVSREHQLLSASHEYAADSALAKSEMDSLAEALPSAKGDASKMDVLSSVGSMRLLLSYFSQAELNSGKTVASITQAIQPYHDAFTLRDGNGEFYFNMALADVVNFSGDKPAAEAAYRALLDDNQGNKAIVYQSLANLYPDAKKTQSILDEAIAKASDANGGIWEELVRKRTTYLLTQPNPDDAIITCLTKLPADTRVGNILDLAVAYAHKNDTANFEATMVKLESLYPTNTSPYREAGWVVWSDYYAKAGNKDKVLKVVSQYFLLRPTPSDILRSGNTSNPIKLLSAAGVNESDSINLYFEAAQNASDGYKAYLRRNTGQLNTDAASAVINQLTSGNGTKVFAVSDQSKQIASAITVANTDHLPIPIFFAQMFNGDYSAACQTAFDNAKLAPSDASYADWIKALSGAVRVNDQCYNGRALDVIKFANGAINANPVSDLLSGQTASLKKRK